MSNEGNLIFTEFYDGQGLGNQLWVYAASRSIAEHLSIPFVIKGIDRFKGLDFLDIATTIGISQDQADKLITQATVNQSIRKFQETSYYDPELEYFSSGFDSRVDALSGVTKLDGLFQSEKYFFGDLARLRQYFVVRPEVLSKNTLASEVGVINLRGGEYKRHNSLILPESYWIKAVENLKSQTDVKNFLVVTDDKAYAKALFPQYDVLQGGIAECYATLYNAQNLILSNSSFAYFPVKTGGNAKRVIAPQHWARFANPYKRWASVANCYEGWQWQDQDGVLKSYENCLSEVSATEALYESTYNVRTTQGLLLKRPFRSFVPQPIRNAAKKILGILFPTRIG